MKSWTQEKLLKQRWYVQGINAAPAAIHAADVTGIINMPKRHGFGYESFIYVFRNDYVDIHYNWDDLKRLSNEVIPRYLRNAGYGQRLLAMTAAEEAPLYDFIKKKLRTDFGRLKSLDNRTLIAEYRRLADIFYHAFATSHLVEPIALTTDGALRDQIESELKARGRAAQFSKLFSLLTQPVDLSYVNRYETELMSLGKLLSRQPKLALLLWQGKLVDLRVALQATTALEQKFSEHLAQWYWIDTNWKGTKPYTLMSVLRHLRAITHKSSQRPVHVHSLADICARKSLLIRTLKLSRRTQQMIHLIELTTKWQDDRKRAILAGVWAFDQYLGALARRFRLKQTELRYLLPEETTLARLSSRGLGAELAKRRHFSVYLAHKKEFAILTEIAARRFVRRLQKDKHEQLNEIDGITASLGKAVGQVRVCLTLAEAAKIKPGEILVTTMTRPEFVPAMKKAAAVVTDEGGLTSHAAIVSRELGIPCVIGTKLATKVLRTGELVEVNANHGLVRVINT